MKHFQEVSKSDLQAVKIWLEYFLGMFHVRQLRIKLLKFLQWESTGCLWFSNDGDRRLFGINTDLRMDPNLIPHTVCSLANLHTGCRGWLKWLRVVKHLLWNTKLATLPLHRVAVTWQHIVFTRRKIIEISLGKIHAIMTLWQVYTNTRWQHATECWVWDQLVAFLFCFCSGHFIIFTQVSQSHVCWHCELSILDQMFTWEKIS